MKGYPKSIEILESSINSIYTEYFGHILIFWGIYFFKTWRIFYCFFTVFLAFFFLTLFTLASACIFPILFSILFWWFWKGELAKQSAVHEWKIIFIVLLTSVFDSEVILWGWNRFIMTLRKLICFFCWPVDCYLSSTAINNQCCFFHYQMLAKLCGGRHKPDKQTLLPQSAVPKLYETVPIKKV